MDLLLRRRMMMRRGDSDPAKMPLTFEILSDGNITWKIGAGSTERTIEYSKNGGEWTAITSTSAGADIPVVAGDVLKFRAGSWQAGGQQNYSKFSSTCFFRASGNPASLGNGDNLSGEEPLAVSAYYCLFFGCTGLTDAGQLSLPATTLASKCYYAMFRGCTSLTQAPELPATTLATECYYEMFSGCTSLTQAPELPATTLASYCYHAMFSGCTSLTQAPELPATTLASYCYHQMFWNCTSLTQAPELPATTLASYCYYQMFTRCTLLNSVKCLATDISASNALGSWLNYVAASGTFYKKAGVTWPSGASGIPADWTVIEV